MGYIFSVNAAIKSDEPLILGVFFRFQTNTSFPINTPDTRYICNTSAVCKRDVCNCFVLYEGNKRCTSCSKYTWNEYANQIAQNEVDTSNSNSWPYTMRFLLAFLQVQI